MAKKKKRKKKLIKNKFRFTIFMSVVLLLAFFGGYSVYKLGANGGQTSTTASPGVTASTEVTESPAVSPSPSVAPSPSSSTEPTGIITSADAAKLVYNLLVKVGDGTKTMFDHVQSRGGVDYYVIRLYESSSDHITTIDWYYVRLDNAKVFLWDIIADTLTPVN